MSQKHKNKKKMKNTRDSTGKEKNRKYEINRLTKRDKMMLKKRKFQ